MRRVWAIVISILVALTAIAGAAAVLAWRGWVHLPFTASHSELTEQLRDRGTVATAGPVPFGLDRAGTVLQDYSSFPALRDALHGRDPARVVEAYRSSRVDGIFVRIGRELGPVDSVLRAMSELRFAGAMTATYFDESAAIYEVRDVPTVSVEDARRMMGVARVILQGAPPPPDRLFPESLRRALPCEVTVILRDGREPILWRAVRGGSISRALVDATYAVLDRWNTRQQQRYGPLRTAALRLPLTIALFYGRSTVGARRAAFLDRVIGRRSYSIGYEHLGRWEYLLPPTPWSPLNQPTRAIQALAREHDVPPPGIERPEIVLYRFRALQLIESTPDGAIEVYDPTH